MGVGLDNVDPAMLRDRGIRMGWTGRTNRRSVAELTVAFPLARCDTSARFTRLCEMQNVPVIRLDAI